MRPARKKLRGAALHARADFLRREIAFAQRADAPKVQAVAREALRLPGWALEKLLAAPQTAQQQALKRAVAVAAQLRASLPRREVGEAEEQLERARAQQEQGEARQSQEAGVEEAEQQQRARQVSSAPLWLRLPWLPYPLLPVVQPQLPRQQASENARAPLPPRLLQSSWSAFFSR